MPKEWVSVTGVFSWEIQTWFGCRSNQTRDMVNGCRSNQTAPKLEEADLTHEEKKLEAKDIFHGNLFFNLAGMILIAALHYGLIIILTITTGVPSSALPTTIQFPGVEIEAFIGLWNPLVLSSTMAFARFSADFLGALSDWTTVVLAVLCLSIVELPWLVWHCWFVFRSVCGGEGLRTLRFNERPISHVLAARPTCKIFSLQKIKYQVFLIFEWVEYILCYPFNLMFFGQWIDDPNSPNPGVVDVYAPLFQKFSPAMGFGWGFLFGAFLLFQKLAVIIIIGTTIKATNLVISLLSCF